MFGFDSAQNTVVVTLYRGTNQKQRFGYVIHTKCTSEKQQIVYGRGPSNINLSIVAPLMFAGLHNHSPLLTMMESNLVCNHTSDEQNRTTVNHKYNNKHNWTARCPFTN